MENEFECNNTEEEWILDIIIESNNDIEAP